MTDILILKNPCLCPSSSRKGYTALSPWVNVCEGDSASVHRQNYNGVSTWPVPDNGTN